MMANWWSCSGVLSTFAPRSSIRVRLSFSAGRNLAMAGRSIWGRVLSTKRAVAISAPVLPAETAAWALPSFTCWMATRMDECFLFFRAYCGASSMPTTSLA